MTDAASVTSMSGELVRIFKQQIILNVLNYTASKKLRKIKRDNE
jgi:hypothetical protein